MRRTGKTFRCILQALLKASEGQDTLILCRSLRYIDDYLRVKIHEILSVYGIEYSYHNRCFKIQNAGIVFLTTKKCLDKYPGSNINNLYYDY